MPMNKRPISKARMNGKAEAEFDSKSNEHGLFKRKEKRNKMDQMVEDYSKHN